MEELESLIKLLGEYPLPGLRLLEREPLKNHTSFRIGGPVRLMAVAEGSKYGGVQTLLRLAMDQGVTPLFMGNGTDLLAPDEGLDRLIIKTTADEITRNETVLTARSGALLSTLAVTAQKAGLTGLEFAHGIPGSVGGGVTMDAGAYGGELRDCLTAVTWLTMDGEQHVSPASDCDLSYRHSVFSPGNRYIVSAQFALQKGDPGVVRAKMEELSQKRREKQPLDLPSAGSTFKRPAGYFAAALIEECGLKGKTIGGAQVSAKHAGFVVNMGGATCHDVRALIDLIQETVFRQMGVQLEPEIKIL
ncbi:MAG: UDP-N-acetylmuramate dehydrogenase [Oscillospiraceae bacterium]